MRKRYFALLAACVFSLAACSGQEPGNGENAAPPSGGKAEPVTIVYFNEVGGTGIVESVQKQVKEKFPQIQLKIIQSGKGSSIEDIVNSGESVDLISGSLGLLWKLKDLRLVSDLTPLMQAHKFDAGRFVPGVAESVKSYSDNGNEFLVMPFFLNNTALFYNKNIFDKFGVPYPRDGMTWEALRDVAKQVTRVEDGVQYKGFQMNSLNIVYKNQLGLPFVDPRTLKAAVNSDGWKRWLEVMSGLYQIDGNAPTGIETDNFLKTQTLAMRTGPNILDQIPAAAAKGLNWDVVTLPTFAGAEGIGSQLNAPYFAIPPAGKHRDEVFQIVAAMLSEDAQILLSRQGRVPVVSSDAAVKAYALDLPGMEGKHLQAFFKEKIAGPVAPTKYDAIAKSELNNKAFVDVFQGGKDANTALREAELSIDKQIEALAKQ
nr:ABC transporter substrate-binding protein [Paenibacillus hamazuiensis]